MECRCNQTMEMHGRDAEDYAAQHLVRGEADDDRLEEAYSCPDTGKRWILDWPESNDRDPGQARLRAASPT